jgi:hypothetical protein
VAAPAFEQSAEAGAAVTMPTGIAVIDNPKIM